MGPDLAERYVRYENALLERRAEFARLPHEEALRLQDKIKNEILGEPGSSASTHGAAKKEALK